MPLPEDFRVHPSPAQVYELAVQYATLLRRLYGHPDFCYLVPPNAGMAKLDEKNTPKGLLHVVGFVQNTYLHYVLPYLPAGASRKCKEVGNPWAYDDPNYQWEWTFDEGAGVMRDARGNAMEFPKLPVDESREHMSDAFTRGLMTKKLILENGTDLKAQMLVGGRPYDFGEDVRRATEALQ
ncbi:hypothetical protein F4780DRAFT_94209 [Xylariomycetidae sp. FL0641]|nr:hypothetical protein F4780DRAFT_94209 [Xylariomycetidae sp. FL0641]